MQFIQVCTSCIMGRKTNIHQEWSHWFPAQQLTKAERIGATRVICESCSQFKREEVISSKRIKA